jgi:hypothetical protein
LTNCEDGSIIHTTSPDVTYLTARNGAFQLTATLDLIPSTQSMTVFINGAILFTWNGTISSALPSIDRTNQFLGEFIAQFNAAALGWTAIMTPPLYNTLFPGNAYGMTIICDTATFNGASVMIAGLNITPIYDPVVDGGAAGLTLRLNEQPGCWTVTGPGNCALATPLTVIAPYADCFRCIPIQPPLVCRDCDSMAFIDGSPLQSTFADQNVNCAYAGQTVHLALEIGFPVVDPVNLIPSEVGTNCSPSCPITYHFAGNQLLNFVEGSTFVVNPSGNVYTVADAVYDQGLDITTVTTVEDCMESSPVASVDTNTGCDCSVEVEVYDIINNSVLETQSFPCIDGYVFDTFDWLVPAEGRYRITVSAGFCGNAKICKYFLNACGEYKVVETDCHEFEIQIARPAPAVDPTQITHTITITDRGSGLVTTVTRTEDQMPYILTTPSDGAYHVAVTNTLTTATWEFEIYDLCDTRACRNTLVTDLFCSCDDPCDKATCVESSERDAKRYLIQRVMMMWNEVESRIYDYRYQYLGIPRYTQERRNDAQDISAIIDRLIDVSSECGICASDTSSSSTTSNCTNCP